MHVHLRPRKVLKETNSHDPRMISLSIYLGVGIDNSIDNRATPSTIIYDNSALLSMVLCYPSVYLQVLCYCFINTVNVRTNGGEGLLL